MFLTARLGSGLVIARLPDDYDEEGSKSGTGTGGGGNHATTDDDDDDDDTADRRRRRGRANGLPRWSAPSAITCSGVGYGFQMGCSVCECMGVGVYGWWPGLPSFHLGILRPCRPLPDHTCPFHAYTQNSSSTW